MLSAKRSGREKCRKSKIGVVCEMGVPGGRAKKQVVKVQQTDQKSYRGGGNLYRTRSVLVLRCLKRRQRRGPQ